MSAVCAATGHCRATSRRCVREPICTTRLHPAGEGGGWPRPGPGLPRDALSMTCGQSLHRARATLHTPNSRARATAWSQIAGGIGLGRWRVLRQTRIRSRRESKSSGEGSFLCFPMGDLWRPMSLPPSADAFTHACRKHTKHADPRTCRTTKGQALIRRNRRPDLRLNSTYIEESRSLSHHPGVIP